ncbi:MAG: nucleotidyltransferase domain-containing protein [Sphingomicrobium sp.]
MNPHDRNPPLPYHSPVRMRREFQLAVQCCRWAFDPGGSAPAEDASADLDWSFFAHLLRRHRVQALVWDCLKTLQIPLPQSTSDAIAADATEILARNLRTARECSQLLESFIDAGVPLMFLKGLSLGALVYRNPFLKAGWDIDLLVPQNCVIAAVDLLRAAGYRLIFPPATDADKRLVDWHRRRKESVWHKSDGDFHVELHSRITDNPRLIPSIGMGSPTQRVTIAPGSVLPTLRLEPLFAYLCVHGATSAWFRLKWICDFAALLHGRSIVEIERLYEDSQRLGAGRSAAQALLLANSLFATIRDTPLEARLGDSRANRWLASAALRQLAGPAAGAEPTERRLGTAMIHLTQLFLLPGASFKIAELCRQARDILR